MHYFDLIRWGICLERHCWIMEQKHRLENFDPVKHKYFPIPESEINNNTNLEQNDPWK